MDNLRISDRAKKYTDDDVNKIINRKYAEWQKKTDELLLKDV
jgi:hypothetical protein